MGYVIGGRVNSTLYSTQLWEYNILNDTWTQKADFPSSGRESAYAIVINNKAYYGTGRSMGSIYHNDWWEYDPTINLWVQKADVPGVARSNAFGFGIGNNGYFGTGYDGTNKLSDFHEYNSLTNTWTSIADYPAGPITYVGGFTINNKGYGVGGSLVASIKELWEYDPSTSTWNSKADFSGGIRYNPVCFTIGNLGYVGIGWGPGSNFQNDFYSYDPVTDTWSPEDALPEGRAWAVGFAGAGKGYVFGGFTPTQSPINDLWEFTPSNVSVSNIVNNDLEISPTISEGVFTILNIENLKDDIQVFSVDGKLAAIFKIQKTIDLTMLKEGTYYLKKNSFSKKIIILKQ
jgi:N-acetylneuraminic acid mutarotase